MFKIPKIIHQIWLGPNARPDIWMNSWKIDYCKKYPDWEYKLWTEKEINEFGLKNKAQYEFEKFYNGKSDIARYEILNKFGGIFIDADSLWIKESKISLDDILNNSNKFGCFCAKEPNHDTIYANGVIGCVSNHKIMIDMIEYINTNYFELKKKLPNENQIWKVCGTYPFSKTVDNNSKYFKNVLILNHKYFYPISFHNDNSKMDISNFNIKFPESLMFQYGYTTNNILHNYCMKKYIDKLK